MINNAKEGKYSQCIPSVNFPLVFLRDWDKKILYIRKQEKLAKKQKIQPYNKILRRFISEAKKIVGTRGINNLTNEINQIRGDHNKHQNY